MITIKGFYVGNSHDTQEAIDFFRRGITKASFKVGKLSEFTWVFQLMEEEAKIVGRSVLDTSLSAVIHPGFQFNITSSM